jgi:serine/threonine-protein kinase RIO1
VIDVPQAVDVRFNHSARDLLGRDVANLCRYFSRYGLLRDPHTITKRLWTQWLTAAR